MVAATTFLIHLMQFADGGNYNQAKLSEAILEVEKVRKAFESKLAKEKTDRSAKEASLKQEDVERLVSIASITFTVQCMGAST